MSLCTLFLFYLLSSSLLSKAAAAPILNLPPLLCRSLALRGAEVILHPTSEVCSNDLTPKDIAKRARAVENMVFVVSANTGGMIDVSFPGDTCNGMSKIVDDRGSVVVRAAMGETMVANAEIDIRALRVRRKHPGMGNCLSRIPKVLITEGLALRAPVEKNWLVDDQGNVRKPERSEFGQRQKAVIKGMIEDGVF